MTKMSRAERIDRLDRFIAEGRLLRGVWTSVVEGVERACLLAAVSPECGEQRTAAACPAKLMPKWLANLTPSIDDAGSESLWGATTRRYAGLIRRWHVLDAATWRRLDYEFRASSLKLAREHVDAKLYPQVVEAVDATLALHACEMRCEHVSADRWSAARSAAESAAESAARSAAESAAESAAWSAARTAAWSAAESAAWDWFIAGLLDSIERECARMERAS